MDAEYICMDSNCNLDPEICILCIKNNHNSCEDNLIIKRNQIYQKTSVLASQTDSNEIGKKLNQMLELKLYEMNKTLLLKK